MVVPPNTKEDFGLTAVEARNLGVPCIITRDGGLPEAGGRQALICEPNDPRALAELLQQAAAMSETEYAERATPHARRTRHRAGANGILRPGLSAHCRPRGSPKMILLAHPFGNANVRAVLAALHEAGLLAKYFTTLGWSNERALRASWPRRGYKLPNDKIVARPTREIVRLLAGTVGLRALIAHERGWASIDQVWRRLDEQSRPLSPRASARPGNRRGLRLRRLRARSFQGRGRAGRAPNLRLADRVLGNGANGFCAKKRNVIRIGSQPSAGRATRKKSSRGRLANSSWPSWSFARAILFSIRCRPRRGPRSLA